MKRIFSILLTISLILLSLPVTPAFAVDDSELADTMYIIRTHGTQRIAGEQPKTAADDWIFSPNSEEYTKNRDNADGMLTAITVRLESDTTTKYFPSFPNADINVDLNGYTWTVTNAVSMKNTGHKITISGGTLTFLGGVSNPIGSYGGEITIRNVVFKNCFCGNRPLISVQNNISNKPGTVMLDNVHFENCSGAGYGSCLYIANRNCTNQINNCTFNNCYAKYGGAIYFGNAENYTIMTGQNTHFNNCEFNNCSALADGGALYFEGSGCNVQMNNCTAYRCHADDCGGFIFVWGVETSVDGAGGISSATLAQRSNIIGCYAVDSGGAYCSSVSSDQASRSTLKNFNIVSCTAGASTHNFDIIKSNNYNSWGGAVCMRAYDAKLQKCDFYDNYSNWYGGAVYCGWSGSSIESCSFYENRCSDGYGNDIYLDSNAGIDVKKCTFLNSNNYLAGKSARSWTGNNVGMQKFNPFSGGDGSIGNPFTISDAGQWKLFALNVINGESYEGKYIELTDDISVAYVPVGKYSTRMAFKGHFNGNNHTIRYLDASDSYDRGVFSYCVNATIENVRVTGTIRGTITIAGVCAVSDNTTFKNVINDADVTSINDSWVGGISAHSTNCRYIQCTNNGTIRGGRDIVGGIAGYSYGKNAEFTDCRNNGEVYAPNIKAGGIIGEATDYVTLKRCVNNGLVNAGRIAGGMIGCLRQGADVISCINTVNGNIHSGTYAAGMVAYVDESNQPVNIKNCANCGGMFLGNNTYGGIVVNFNNDKLTVANCFNATGDMKYIYNCGGITAGSGKGIYVNCYCKNGPVNDNHATTLEPEDCKETLAAKMNTYIRENTDSSERIDWPYWSVNNSLGYALPDIANSSRAVMVGSGTAEDPFLISGPEHLEDLANDLSHQIDHRGHYFKLTGSFSYTGAPIGGDKMDFAGHFDGDYHTLTVDIEGGNCTGLFGQAWGGSIRNLTVAGTVKGGVTVGGIVGHAHSGLVIDNCRVIANVTGAYQNVGGIAGAANNATISNCRVDGTVTGGWTSVGGIVGWSGLDIKIINCVSAGDVTGSQLSVGGIVGYISGETTNAKIVNCAALGKLSETEDGTTPDGLHFGGIVACIDSAINSLVIQGCYSCCTVGGQENRGFIIGFNAAGAKVSTTEVYYTSCSGVKTTTGKGTAVAATAKTALKLSEAVKALNSYAKGKAEGDIALTQWTKDGKTIYPKSFICAPLEIRGKGTENDPYRVSLPEHLEQISSNVNNGETYKGKYFRLTRSFAYEGSQIGCSGSCFAGVFDGDYHTLTLTLNGGSHTALFYEIDSGTVQNLEVAGTVKGTNCVGAIAGYATLGSLIDNCRVTASVTGTAENVGGIVGIMNNSTISNCRVEGKVSGGPNMIGGIVGWINNSSRIYNCVVGEKAKVTGTFLTVGGIAGYATEGDSIIANCASLGSVALASGGDVNNSHFGGIVGCVGSINSLFIYGCYSCCTVGGTGNRGFIIGWIDAGSNVKTQEVYYTPCTGVSSAVGHGTQVAATAVTTKNDALKASVTALNKFVKTSPVSNATLTTWKVDGTTIIPKNYVNMLSLTASVFSEQNLPAVIIIGVLLFVAIIGITVLSVRRKKKESALIAGNQ